MKSRETIFIFAIYLLILSQPALAQVTTGTILGVVRDGTGAVIPGVSITVKNLDTGTARNVVSDEQGRYQASSLALGNYEAEAQKEGFQAEVRRGIELTVGREAVLNFELQVGAVTQTVEVAGEAPLIETTSASVSGLIETSQIQNLPLNGRSFDELALLEPGVVISKFTNGSSAFQTGYTTKISIRGSRPEQNSFLLDGTGVMGPNNQIPGSVGGQSLGVDAVREFRVETGTFSAQYGQAAGGVINVISKSGSNKLHGTLFEFLRNDNLDARSFFDPERPKFVRNQFGGSAGGPIRKDKLFFFGNYEGLRERLGQSIIATVPTAGARQGLIPNPKTGTVQQVTVNPTVIPFLNLFPLPNGRDFGDGTGQLIAPYSQPTDEDFVVGRADYNLSASDSWFGRYTFDNGRQTPATNYNFITANNTNRNQFVTLQEMHIFSPTLLNTVRFGLNRTRTALLPAIGLDQSLLEKLALVPGQPMFESGSSISPGAVSATQGGGGVSSMGNPNVPRVWAWNVFEGSDDLTKTMGSHSLRAGVLFKRTQFNTFEAINAGGALTFGSLTAFLQGAPNDLRVLKPGGVTSNYWRYNYFGWYAQDDIRLTPRFTLNAGFRHEFYTAPTDRYGNFCNLDNIYGTFHCGAQAFRTGDTIKDFGPRMGFAWDVLGDGRTSVRGGVGMYYDSMAPSWWYVAGDTQPPASRVEIVNPPFPNPYPLLISGGATDVQLTPSPSGVSAVPSTLQYSLTVQRQLSSKIVFSLGYVGSQGRHMFTRGQENIVLPTILPDGRKFFPAGGTRIRTDIGNTRYVRTQANSSYNGLMATLQQRLSRGLQFQLSYTYSKALDVNPVPNTSQLMDSQNWRLDYGPSDYNTGHNIASNFSWDLPFGTKLTGAAARLAGGWQLQGVVRFSSSSPLSITDSAKNWSRNGSTGSSILERPDLVAGKNNNPILGSPDQWFDPSVFQVQQSGFYGNLGRNTLSGPNLTTVDFSLIKNLRLPLFPERMGLQFRAEFFNIINRANFAAPITDIFDTSGKVVGNAGVITATTTSPREIQFGLKLSW